MADRITPIHDVGKGTEKNDPLQMLNQVKDDINHLIEGLDLRDISRRVEDFGRRNPVGLALAAASIGVAAGLLMRKSPKVSS